VPACSLLRRSARGGCAVVSVAPTSTPCRPSAVLNVRCREASTQWSDAGGVCGAGRFQCSRMKQEEEMSFRLCMCLALTLPLSACDYFVPRSTCPEEVPEAGSECPTGFQCPFYGPCVVAQCNGDPGWELSTFEACAPCPSSSPADGSDCPEPPLEICHFDAPDGSQACFLDGECEDGAWVIREITTCEGI
jgi:hypothetical protein